MKRDAPFDALEGVNWLLCRSPAHDNYMAAWLSSTVELVSMHVISAPDKVGRGFRFDVLQELPSLQRYARTLSQSDFDAQDLVHDTLVRAYEKRASFRTENDMRVWLLSILHNIFIDGVRARAAEAQRLVRLGEQNEEHLAPAQDHRVRFFQVRQALLQLPEDQRAALHLVAIEGLTYGEAAAALDIPIGTLMSRIARARETLRAVEGGARRQNLR